MVRNGAVFSKGGSLIPFAALIDGSKITVSGDKVSGARNDGTKWTAKIDGGELLEYEDTITELPDGSFRFLNRLQTLKLPEVTFIVYIL